MNRRSSLKAVFVGSFDPFHAGHKNVVERALQVVDKVVIGVSVNDDKLYSQPMSQRVEAIRQIFHADPRVTVEANTGLTIDFAHHHGAQVIVKGVRNVEDFVYEQEQALWNKRHGNIDTLLLVADEEYSRLSSTSIRENLQQNNK